jgi:radical SAM superfamily enzyme YgiQ (UPF0313 family)
LGLAALIKYYEKHGLNKDKVQFRIFDEYAENEDLTDAITGWKPDLVGIGSMSVSRTRAFEVARRIRALEPGVLLISGGVHFQVRKDDGLVENVFDANCIGEGEEPLRLLIDRAVVAGEGKACFAEIPNLAFLNADKTVAVTDQWVFEDLAGMAMPDLEWFNTKYYFSRRQFVPGVFAPSIGVMTSRGCPFVCTFCFNSFNAGKVRYYDINHVVDNILRIRRTYGVKHFSINDELFFMNRKRVQVFCARLLKEGSDIRWVCNARPSVMQGDDLQLLRQMREAGCIMILYGFESGSDAVLRRIKGKDSSVEKNQRALDQAVQAGLNVFGMFLCGIPGETEEEMIETGNFIRRNWGKLYFLAMSVFVPFPGAALSEEIWSKGALKGTSLDDLGLNMFGQGAQQTFNDNVSAYKILQFRKRIMREAMSRWPLREKLKWLVFEAMDNPRSSENRNCRTFEPEGAAE